MGAEGATRKRADRFKLRVVALAREAEDIVSVALARPDGGKLPAFTAGAHIDVHFANGLTRQYSLCNHPAERWRYLVAVLREASSLGGSRAMHELRRGDALTVSGPHNNFPLAGLEADHHLLLAGGIGITPMMAMIAELKARRAAFRLHYCTRSRERTAFLRRLQPLVKRGTVVVHHDDGDPGHGLDIAALLAEPTPGRHVYACGPRGFMQAVKASVGAWPPHAVHFEYFHAVALTEQEAAWDRVPFKIGISRTGELIDVPANCSIVKALRDHGIDIETSCEEGYCGTCITRCLEGDPVHRDSVLSESERETFVMVCRARSRSPVLVLDV
jgi:vanillate monooxygenase ferredoxin subunit